MISVATAHLDPRMEEVARRQRKAFVEKIRAPHDENVARRYAWATAEFWRVYRLCEIEDQEAARRARTAA